MKYTLGPSENRRYIILKVQGDINRQSAMEQNIEAHALGRELGINRYLVDVTESRNTDSPQGNYDFAYRDMKKTEGIDPLARVAALVSSGDHTHDFVETVARNAGLNMRIFTDPDLAREFLEKE